jgi:uncharacterized protein YkwD
LALMLPGIGPAPVTMHVSKHAQAKVSHRKHRHRNHRHRKHAHGKHAQGRRGHRAQAACQDANQPASALSLSAARVAVVCLFNHERSARGLPLLTESSKLDRSAQGWTDRMVVTADFSHGASFSTRFTVVGYNWQTVGENIAAGQRTPLGVVKAWMASTGHCQNILQPEFKDVGVGVSTTPVPSWGTAPVTWTADFGLSMGQSPASHDMGPANGCPYH